MTTLPFQGNTGGNQTLLATGNVEVGTRNKSVRLVNAGTEICYVRAGVGAQVATVFDLPVLPGESIVINKSQASDNVAAHMPAATILHIQPGSDGV